MNFKINPAAYGDVFVLPKAVVKNNLRLAGAVQLKALLYLYCNSGVSDTSCEAIANALGADRGDVCDALIFWCERGLVIKDDATAPVVPADLQPEESAKLPAEAMPSAVKGEHIQAPQNTEPERKLVPELPISRPSHEQIAIRCNECEEFRLLFAEAQNVLGKTIGYEGQSILIMLHDSYDLPVEVILMLLEYAVKKGKTGYKYIATVGKEWSEKEIVTIDAAEEYISEQNETDELWKSFKALTGVKNPNPTAKQKKFLTLWKKEFSFSAEMISLAYEICIDNTGKMNLEYMNKVLKNWHEKGVKSPADAQREQAKWNESNFKKTKDRTSKPKQEVFSSDASYDLEKFDKNIVGLKYLEDSNQ